MILVKSLCESPKLGTMPDYMLIDSITHTFYEKHRPPWHLGKETLEVRLIGTSSCTLD